MAPFPQVQRPLDTALLEHVEIPNVRQTRASLQVEVLRMRQVKVQVLSVHLLARKDIVESCTGSASKLPSCTHGQQ